MKKLILTICMLLLCIPNLAYAYENTVTIDGFTYSYFENGEPAGYNQHAVFKASSGNPVYCGNHGYVTPVGKNIGDSKSFELHEYNNNLVRKVLYYGYLGPKEWEGFKNKEYNKVYKAYTDEGKRKWCGNAVTGMALTKTQSKGYLYNISGFESFWEYITNAPNPPEGFKAYIMYGNEGEQNLFTWSYNPIGHLKIEKDIAKNKHLVLESSKYYSLEGAIYTISLDKEGKNIIGELVTDKEGVTEAVNLKPGKYYIKEKVAPMGFELDKQIYEVEVKEEKMTSLKVSDEPVFMPLDLLLLKVDSQTGAGLEGGVFCVKYYDQLLDETENVTPTRTWILMSDNEGKVHLQDSYKVDGDDFYIDDDGNPIGLIGTYEISEIMAPKGYTCSMSTVITHVKRDSNNNIFYNPPTISNQRQSVSITLQKYDGDIVSDEDLVPQSIVLLKGAVYEVLDENRNVVGEIVTDENGVGTIRNLEPGTYILKEIKAPDGYLINEDEIIVDCIPEDDNVVEVEYHVSAVDYPSKIEIDNEKETEIESVTEEKIPVPKTMDDSKIYAIIWAIVAILAALFSLNFYKKINKKY